MPAVHTSYIWWLRQLNCHNHVPEWSSERHAMYNDDTWEYILTRSLPMYTAASKHYRCAANTSHIMNCPNSRAHVAWNDVIIIAVGCPSTSVLLRRLSASCYKSVAQWTVTLWYNDIKPMTNYICHKGLAMHRSGVFFIVINLNNLLDNNLSGELGRHGAHVAAW